MDVCPDAVADLVQRTFDALPAKCKPRCREGNEREWIPLSGIVASGKDGLKCLAVATGMKCLPQSKVESAQGLVIHDWHAEILVIRSFNRYLLDECLALAVSKGESSELLRRRRPEEQTESQYQPFALNDGIQLHMYCSEAPCGDASMELTMAAQDDATPWSLPPRNPESSPQLSDSETPLYGRGYFSALGIVRRKPSRPDAPPTLSKSCSDKIALKQCTSLLSTPASLLISPHNLYLASLILPSTQLSPAACTRAFSPTGRLAPLDGRSWDGGYAYRPFDVRSTAREFAFSRRPHVTPLPQLVPSNVSACWSPAATETLIGGVLQGRKVSDPRGASRVCKRRTWRLAAEVATVLALPALQRTLRGGDTAGTYAQVKAAELGRWRRRVKEDVRREALKGWARNAGDDFSMSDILP